MIYELRIYTCKPGTCDIVLSKWEKEGKAMLAPYFHMVGQWVAISGELNQIYTLWQFTDLNHRREARRNLLKHPGFAGYLADCRSYYIRQECIFLEPTELSPIR